MHGIYQSLTWDVRMGFLDEMINHELSIDMGIYEWDLMRY
jgi:hypothetical protein